jgi:hypothetical protein
MRRLAGVLGLALLLPCAAGAVTLKVEVSDGLYEALRTAVVGTLEAPASPEDVQAYVQREAGNLLRGLGDQGLRRQAGSVAEAYLTGDAARRQAIQAATQQGGPRQETRGAGSGAVLASVALPLLGLAGSVWQLGWDVGSWVLSCMLYWLAGYLLWEARPCRRLLWGVTRKLYGRSLED